MVGSAGEGSRRPAVQWYTHSSDTQAVCLSQVNPVPIQSSPLYRACCQWYSTAAEVPLIPQHLLIFYFSTLVQALTYQRTHTTVTSQVLEGNLQEHDSLRQVSMKWNMPSSQSRKYKLQFIRQLTPKHRGHPLKHNPKNREKLQQTYLSTSGSPNPSAALGKNPIAKSGWNLILTAYRGSDNYIWHENL